ncbi:hypothetical protein Tco_1165557 [Tanacetum coccineum]
MCEDEESKDAFVHTPEDYVPTDDETNDVDEEEYERKESGPEMASTQVQYVVQATITDTPAIQNATTEVPPLSSSISSTYTNAFLNLENLHSTKTEVVSMLDINVQHEVPRTSPLLTIPALMELILEDEDVMDKGAADELKKRKPDDADKDEGPTAGLDQGLKRQRTSKGTETSKKISTLKESSKGKSSTTSSKSGKSANEQVKEPIFVQDSDYVKHDDAEFDNIDMPMDQGEDLGKTDEQPNDEVVPNNNWYKKSKSDTSLDPEWNKGKLVDDGPEQSWLNDMAKYTKPPLTFDELMHTLIDFSAFAMNHLKIDNLTKEHLVGPIYNLLKGTCKSYVELDYTMEECYRALSKQIDWNNPEGHRCPYDLTKPLPMQMSSQGRQIVPVDFFFNNDLEYLRGGSNDKKYTASTTKSKAARYELKGIEDMYDVYPTKRILSNIIVKVVEWYGYGHLEYIVVKRADQKLYTLKEGDFKRLHLNDIEDMLLLVVQNKLHNLDTNVMVHLAVNLRMFAQRTVIQARVEDLQLGVERYQKKLNLTKPRTRDIDMSCRPAYTTLSNPQGVFYEDKLKQKRFMRAEELHKFSVGTLISVRDTLDQMLHELHLGYNTAMRRRLWTRLDQQRTHIMIKAINQKLLDRRIMRSLEKFVGGRDYGKDLILLQPTI